MKFKSIDVLYKTTTYNRGRFELFVLLSSSLPDDLRLPPFPFKGSVLGADISTGGVGEVLRDGAEAHSDSDGPEDSKETRRRRAI